MKYREIQIYRENGKWWLADPNNPDTEFQINGPHNTKAEAAEAKQVSRTSGSTITAPNPRARNERNRH